MYRSQLLDPPTASIESEELQTWHQSLAPLTVYKQIRPLDMLASSHFLSFSLRLGITKGLDLCLSQEWAVIYNQGYLNPCFPKGSEDAWLCTSPCQTRFDFLCYPSVYILGLPCPPLWVSQSHLYRFVGNFIYFGYYHMVVCTTNTFF